MQSTFLLNLTKVITCATHVDAFLLHHTLSRRQLVTVLSHRAAEVRLHLYRAAAARETS